MGLAKTGLADTPGRNSGCPVSYDFDSLPPEKFITFALLVSRLKLIFPLVEQNYPYIGEPNRILEEEEEEGKKRFLLLSRGRKKRIIIGRKRDLDSKEWSSGEEKLRQDRYSEAFYYRLDGWNGRYGKGYLCKV